MIGRKKTMDLIKKGEDSIVRSSKGIMSKTVSYDATKVKNKKELDEINRARDLLRAGRDRNRNRKYKLMYEGKKGDVNNTINQKDNIFHDMPDKWERKKAVEQSKITNPKRVKESIAKHEAKAAELRAKKEAGKMLKKGGKIALATGGVIAAGVGAKKLVDKKKAKKDDNSKK